MEKQQLNLPQKIDFLIDRLEVIETMLQKKESLRVYSKKLNLDYALSFLLKEGFSMSKSRLYKLTSTNSIPCARFGSRLVFDRDELIKWCSVQSETTDTRSMVSNKLAIAASRKVGYGKA
ncbi:MAG: DNA-binding protein [Flavobacterium sp.]|nr:MAG: DNA-binding protein [Flavobacterium sp.]